MTHCIWRRDDVHAFGLEHREGDIEESANEGMKGKWTHFHFRKKKASMVCFAKSKTVGTNSTPLEATVWTRRGEDGAYQEWRRTHTVKDELDEKDLSLKPILAIAQEIDGRMDLTNNGTKERNRVQHEGDVVRQKDSSPE